jgi:outer membrane protein assembly factor BamB
MLRITLLVVLALFISSCSKLPNWMGESEAPKLKGERISLLGNAASLKPASELEKVQITLPAPEENTASKPNKSGHPALAEKISVQQKERPAEAAKETYILPAPIIAEGKLFLLDGRANVIALDAGDIRKILWKTALLKEKKKNYSIGGGLAYVAYDKGMIFASTGHKEIIALQASDGKEVWRKPVSNVVRAAPSATNGKVTVITIDNYLYILNEADGSVFTTRAGVAESVGVFGSAAPITERGLLLVPQSSGELLGINAANGQEVWSANLTNRSSSGSFPLNGLTMSPVVHGEAVYAVSNAGGLVALAPTSGIQLWEHEVPEIQAVWAAGDFLYATSQHNAVAAIRAQDGNIKWVTALPEFGDESKQKDKIIASQPVLAGGNIYVALSNGKLAVLSPMDGKIKQMISINEDVTQAPVVASGKLYLLSNEGEVEVLY